MKVPLWVTKVRVEVTTRCVPGSKRLAMRSARAWSPTLRMRFATAKEDGGGGGQGEGRGRPAEQMPSATSAQSEPTLVRAQGEEGRTHRLRP